MHYPNIELLEYKANQILVRDHDTSKRFIPDYNVYVFPQVWPNTGGGMARKGYCYGQAITKEYTTVFVNTYEDAAVVCFGNRVAYMVKPIPQVFYEDMKDYSIAGTDYTERYNNENVCDAHDE